MSSPADPIAWPRAIGPPYFSSRTSPRPILCQASRNSSLSYFLAQAKTKSALLSQPERRIKYGRNLCFRLGLGLGLGLLLWRRGRFRRRNRDYRTARFMLALFTHHITIFGHARIDRSVLNLSLGDTRAYARCDCAAQPVTGWH